MAAASRVLQERGHRLGFKGPHVSHQERMHAKSLSCIQLFATLWTVAHQAPLSMGFFRQEYWNGWLCPPPGDLNNPGVETHISYVSCVGRQVLYHLGSPSYQEEGAQMDPEYCGIPGGGCPSITPRISISHSSARCRQLPEGQMFAINLHMCMVCVCFRADSTCSLN